MKGWITADTQRLRVSGAVLSPGSAVSVLLSGRRIWTFRVPEQGELDGLTIDWPPALAERLTGRALLAVEHDGDLLTDEQPVQFDESGGELLLCEPATGVPLVVNKWGRIARSFEGRDASLIEDVLDEAEHVISLLRDRLGLELFVTGGTLLGPVRNGRIMAHDDDADLAYLSAHENPTDVVLESFAVERLLTSQGYEVVRHSGGHLQLMFPGGTVADRFYVDIFTYFVCSGWFHGPFHARERAELVRILPLKALAVNGRQLPGPADPPQLLAAIYGSGWAVPDPTFRFVTPPAAARRFFWWLNHFDVDRENWEDLHRAEIQAASAPRPSQFVRSLPDFLPAGSSVLDLGCGLGADARFLAGLGHDVLAVDFSRPALAYARASADGVPGGLRYERVNLNMARHALHLRKECAGMGRPVHVYGNQLFNALSPLGWDTTLKLIEHLLADGGRGFFEVGTGGAVGSTSWSDYRPVDWQRFQEQLRRYRLVIEEEATVPAAESAGIEVRQVRVRRETNE